MRHKDTKGKLLDVAEEMFAVKGFANTSMRSLTAKAGANLAAVNYHFGSKEGLLNAVLERRLLPLNQLRRHKLEEIMQKAQASGVRPDVRQLLRTFIEPTLLLRCSGRGARAFITIISRALGDPDPTVRSSFITLIMPILHYFKECLAVSLPHLPPQELFWRFHCTMGAITHVLHGLDKKEMFPREMIPEDTGELVETMLTFLTAGMEAKF